MSVTEEGIGSKVIVRCHYDDIRKWRDKVRELDAEIEFRKEWRNQLMEKVRALEFLAENYSMILSKGKRSNIIE